MSTMDSLNRFEHVSNWNTICQPKQFYHWPTLEPLPHPPHDIQYWFAAFEHQEQGSYWQELCTRVAGDAVCILSHACNQWLLLIGFQTLTTAEQHAIQQLMQEQHRDQAFFRTLPDLNKPGLCVLDMDSTAIATECIDMVADHLDCAQQVHTITEQAMQGEIDFTQSIKQRVHLLAGLPYVQLEKLAHSLPIRPGLTQWVNTLHQHNWRVILISGGFAPFTQTLADAIGVDGVYANTLEVENAHLTGQILGTIVDAQAKQNITQMWQHRLNIDATQTIAIGDGANDQPMLSQAGFPVGMHPKPIVIPQVRMTIYQRDFTALSMLFKAYQNVTAIEHDSS